MILVMFRSTWGLVETVVVVSVLRASVVLLVRFALSSVLGVPPFGKTVAVIETILIAVGFTIVGFVVTVFIDVCASV